MLKHKIATFFLYVFLFIRDFCQQSRYVLLYVLNLICFTIHSILLLPIDTLGLLVHNGFQSSYRVVDENVINELKNLVLIILQCYNKQVVMMFCSYFNISNIFHCLHQSSRLKTSAHLPLFHEQLKISAHFPQACMYQGYNPAAEA